MGKKHLDIICENHLDEGESGNEMEKYPENQAITGEELDEELDKEIEEESLLLDSISDEVDDDILAAVEAAREACSCVYAPPSYFMDKDNKGMVTELHEFSEEEEDNEASMKEIMAEAERLIKRVEKL